MNVNGGDRERLPPKPSPTFSRKVNRRSCNDGSRELILAFHNPHRKDQPSPSTVDLTLVDLVWVPSKATSSGREENQVRINIQKALEYLKGGNQVSPKSSPLQDELTV